MDDFLARRTPGRLLLYYLGIVLTYALALSFLGQIPQLPLPLIFTTALLLASCWAVDWVFAKTFGVKSKWESVVATGLILSLIISPVAPDDFPGLMLPLFAALWAMASKYAFAIDRKHLFNPAAFGVVLAMWITGHGASWWIGSSQWILPLVLAGGVLMTRKMRCLDLLLPFAAAALGVILVTAPKAFVWLFVSETLLHSAFFFFAFVMLTEPRTLPFGRPWRMAFAVIVGLFYTPSMHIGALRFAPETALLLGNVFAFAAKWQKRRQTRLARAFR